MYGLSDNMAGLLERNNNSFGLNPYSPLPRYKVIKVKGEAGAKNFKMGPDSSALLLDESGLMVWLVQTDGTGLISATPFDITLHQETPPIDVNNLAERVAQLEELINAKYNNVGSSKQSRKQQQHQQSTVDKKFNESGQDGG